MKSKKGFGLHYVIIPAIVLGLGFFIVARLETKEFQGVIGYHSFSLIKSANDAEAALLYIDQSAKNSLPQAIYDLAQNGGILEIEFSDNEKTISYECGKFNDAFVWYQISKDKERDCFDEKTANFHLQYYFNNILNDFLRNYPGNLLADNYNYEAIGNIEILGKAKEPLEFDIIKPEEEQITAEASADEEGFVDLTSTEHCPRGKKCKLKKEAYDLFVIAYNIAKQRGKELEFVSGYRTVQQQIDLWEGNTPENYAQIYPNKDERKKYVCNPEGGSVACPHLTGYAVDVTFKGKKASELPRAEQQSLHEIMTQARDDNQARWIRYGDVNDPSKGEPWHFECCNTARYQRAIALGEQTGEEVTAIV